jgi:hypothetical protein
METLLYPLIGRMHSVDPDINFQAILIDDFYNGALDLLMLIGYLIPAILVLKRYRKFMDSFTISMIIIYIVGFTCKKESLLIPHSQGRLYHL